MYRSTVYTACTVQLAVADGAISSSQTKCAKLVRLWAGSWSCSSLCPPKSLGNLHVSQGSRSTLKSPGQRCCKPIYPKAAMVDPNEKAKCKIIIRSDIVSFEPLFSGGLSNTVIHQPGISFTWAGNQKKRRKLPLSILLMKRRGSSWSLFLQRTGLNLPLRKLRLTVLKKKKR